MAEKEYRRITRWRARSKGLVTALGTRSSLWLAKDHILSIDSNRVVEEYKRFYFRDIQAFTIRQTRQRFIWNLILGTAMLITFILVFSLSGNLATAGTSSIPWLVIFLIPMLINSALGPTCVCYIRTAVQVDQLPPLNRMRRAHRFIERIRPLIASAQGSLTPEQISMGLGELTKVAAAAAATATPRVATGPLNLS